MKATLVFVVVLVVVLQVVLRPVVAGPLHDESFAMTTRHSGSTLGYYLQRVRDTWSKICPYAEENAVAVDPVPSKR
ncbi:hypothetical protein J6590_086361 [Homalodisca vitripennis]|nr:hypothetical protein J6590_086361 [Homalodisca vitripennis]